MSKTKVVGYKIKKSFKAGDMVSEVSSLYEPVYEAVDPIDELAEYAHGFAYYQNNQELTEKIDELVKQIKGES